jgi:hypothetical protein
MTEAEWLAGADLDAMLIALTDRMSVRKGLLFGLACCRRIGHHFRADRSRACLNVVEHYADGLAGPEDLWSAHDAVVQEEIERRERQSVSGMAYAALEALSHPSGPGPFRVAEFAAAAFAEDRHDRQTGWNAVLAVERKIQCELLREVVGNRFRPARAEASWLCWHGGTIPDLAPAVYDGKAFDRLPVLADALEEAACTDTDVLAHCRRAGGHVRGCWVVDVLLGKE